MAGDIFETDGQVVTRIILASTWPRQLHCSASEEGGWTQNAEVSGSRKALAEGSVFPFEAMHTVPLLFFYCIVMNLWVNNSTIFFMTSYNSPKPILFLTILEAFTEIGMENTVLHTSQCLRRLGGANTESIICGDIKNIFSLKFKDDHMRAASDTCNCFSSLLSCRSRRRRVQNQKLG